MVTEVYELSRKVKQTEVNRPPESNAMLHGKKSLGCLAVVTVLFLAGLAERTECQERQLERAVQQAQEAWLRHNVDDLVSGSDTVRLHIPDLPPSASLRPGQASRLLDRYLSPTEEVSFVLLNVRELAEDHAYAEVQRVFVIKGTVEQREETVFLGFRRIRGLWSLREVRVTP